jgi:ABC-type phosphate transport system substrate-binding protein
MRAFRAAAAVLATLALTACGSDTSPTTAIQPNRPSLDGSGMVGSGNIDSDTVAGNGSTTAAGDTTTLTERGSGMVGSGN